MLLTKEAYRQKMKELEQLNEKLKEVRKGFTNFTV